MRPKKKINQTDIAKALGISNVSVSNALAGRKGVSDGLIRKVRQAAAEMGYETGKEPAAGSLDVVVLVTPSRQAAGRIDEIVRKQRFQVKHYTIGELLSGEREKMRELETCTGILIPEPLPATELAFLKGKSGRPILGIGFFDSHVPLDYVLDDGLHGAQLMVQYLRAKGYEKILYVKPDADEPAGRAGAAMLEDRLLGYRSERYLETLGRGRTMEQAQPFDIGETQDILTVQGARAYIGNWRDAGEQPRTAFFCGDLKTARLLLSHLEQNQIAVPGEIGLAGYTAGEEHWLQEGKQITAYENGDRNLLEQCCAILWESCRGGEMPRGVHLILGEITEGCTA